jgi:uncharacterized RDD family membrane protein YckC
MSILSLGLDQAQPSISGAGFWIRALARLIDTAYGYAVGFSAGLAAVILLGILQALSLVEPGWALRMAHSRIFLFPMSLVGMVLYETICEAGCGATLGKLVCGVRVLSEKQARCSFLAAFIRSLAYFVDSLVFGLVGYLSMNKTNLQQRHGDHWAKTIVVRRGQVPVTAARSGLASIGAITLGSLAWILPLSTTMVLFALG